MMETFLHHWICFIDSNISLINVIALSPHSANIVSGRVKQTLASVFIYIDQCLVTVMSLENLYENR